MGAPSGRLGTSLLPAVVMTGLAFLAGAVATPGTPTAATPAIPSDAPSPSTPTTSASPSTAALLAGIVHEEPRDRSAPPTASPTPRPTLPGQPSLTVDLRGQLDCDQAYHHGKEVPDYAFGPGGSTARATFERIIDLHLVPYLPLRGYAIEPLREHWARLVYAPGGRTKALVVATDTSAEFPDGDWHVVGLMVCASVEFDPADGLSTGDATWTDAIGRPVGANVLVQRGDCYGGTQLRMGGRLYVRDPLGAAYEPQQLLTPYDGDATLPADAVATAYRDGDRRLFRIPDRSVVYVVSPTTTERWPRVRGDDYERIDCN